MNIHPFLVHFPIALFCVYTILECVRFQVVIKQPYWFYLKAGIVIMTGTPNLAHLPLRN